MFCEKNQKYLKIFNNENTNINFIYFIIKNFLLLFFILHQQVPFIKKIVLYKKELLFYKNYIIECKETKEINFEEKIQNNHPYFSIVIPVYNSEKYIENALFSAINQSFKNFEIIIINDFSNDNTTTIIQKIQSKSNKIKIINHSYNMGIYTSRVEGIINSNGIYIIYLDSDDLFLNPYLFQNLYDFNFAYNLDILEFIVLYQKEGKKQLYMPTDHTLNHYHNFKEKIIKQPELSDVLFYKPRTLNYSQIICRTLWSKIVRRDIFIKTLILLEIKITQNLIMVKIQL
jgi:glycosyltransferase involved in cell wall biosynthesis